MTKKNARAGLRQNFIAASVAACFSLSSQQALANPNGAAVVAGSASFATAGSMLTITNTPGTIINWQGFSIGVNEITRFIQQHGGSAVLNRVVGGDPSNILGTLQSMLSSGAIGGKVFLINPNGIIFGAGARIDVGGLVASTLALSNDDFLAGRNRFTEVPGAGGIANHGTIETPSGGKVYLVAPSVENHGIIRAPQGEVILAAGKSAELVNENSPFVTVRVTADAEQAMNVGSLIAESGKIGVYGALVRNSGVAEAGGAVMGPGGQIRFVATKDLSLDATSRVSANGTSGGDVLLQAKGGTNLVGGMVEAKGSAGKGGTVQALGVRVGVVGHGVIDASGDTGGGTVLIGGDYKGGNAEVQNAQSTFISADGVIRADAGTSGDGGKVIVWADGTTRFHGSISAKGGSQSGNGGFVETSGKGSLVVTGRVDTSSAHGHQGSWLLDPDILNILASAYYGNSDSLLSDGQVNFGEGPTTSDISVSAIEGYTGNVILQANSEMNFLASLNKTNGGLNASVTTGNINLNGNTIAVSDSLYLNAGGGGSITSSMAGSLTTQLKAGSFIQLHATGGSVATGAIQTVGSGSSSVYVNASSAVTTGPIATSASTGSWISLAASGGPITVHGPVQTGVASAGSIADSHVSITASGGMATVHGAIKTGMATGAGANSSVTVQGAGVNIGGGIETGTGAGSAYGTSTFVSINAAGGALNVAGLSTGAATGQASAQSYVYAQAGYGVMFGAVQTGAATSTGSSDSRVELRNSSGGNIGGGAIVTGNATGPSSAKSKVHLENFQGGISVGSISSGTATGSGSDANVYAKAWNGALSTQAIFAGAAANNGSVDLFAKGGMVVGNVATSGTSFGYGGVTALSYGAIQTGSVTVGSSAASGRNIVIKSMTDFYGYGGGNILTGSLATRNMAAGYGGGNINVEAANGSVTVGGVIDTRGADGGGAILNGGYGGNVTLISPVSVAVGPVATSGVQHTVINTGGGNGASGGAGGKAGNLFVDPQTIQFNGNVFLVGGAGNGGAGGAGGNMTLLTTNGAGTITFINGGYDISGGSGSPPGAAGIGNAQGTLIFVSLLTDVFKNPAVAASIGSTVNEVIKTSEAQGEQKSDEPTDQKKDKGLGSCKS